MAETDGDACVVCLCAPRLHLELPAVIIELLMGALALGEDVRRATHVSRAPDAQHLPAKDEIKSGHITEPDISHIT